MIYNIIIYTADFICCLLFIVCLLDALKIKDKGLINVVVLIGIVIGIVLYSQQTQAETIPKPSGTYSCTMVDFHLTRTGSDLEAACDAAFTDTQTNLCPNYNEQSHACNNLGSASTTPNQFNGRYYYSYTQTSQTSGQSIEQATEIAFASTGGGSCPSGYTDNGSTCTRADCESGQKRDSNGACVSDCSLPFRDLQGATFGGAGQSPASLCVNGCTYTPINSVQGCKSGSCKFESHLGKPTGANCEGSGSGAPVEKNDQNRTPDEKCISQGQGYIETNGIITCVGAGSGGGGDTTVNNGIDPPVTFKDGGGVDTNGDGTPDKSNETYCKENPSADTCNGTFTGSCTNGFSCNGDAAQCAIAKLQYEQNCQLNQNENGLNIIGTAIANGNDAGQLLNPASNANRLNLNLPTALNEGDNFTNSQLSDQSFQVANQTIVIPFSQLNTIVQYMGYVVLAFSYLSAAYIVGVRGS